MARLLRWTIVVVMGWFSLAARAADDWIDELPTVTVVAHAVADQLKIDTADWRFDVRGIALKDDDDLFAVYMVGTLVMLRQIILYKYQEEKSLSPEREAKLRCAVATYLEAELLIGQMVGKRRGYLTTAQKCGDMECYRRWFKLGVHGVGGASFRRRILPRLFPRNEDRAAELDRLAQFNAARAPYMPSPALTREMEPEVAGLAPAGCSVYGGDGNRNGLCDDWENPEGSSIAFSCGIVLEKVRMAANGGLWVTLAKGPITPGASAKFRVLRGENPAIDARAIEVWPRDGPGEAVILATEAEATLHAIVAKGADLTPDPKHPYLLVEITSSRASAPVHCEQPLKTWLMRQLKGIPSGLHGPYDTADLAVQPAGQVALAMTTTNFENGFVILRNRGIAKGGYYTTAPTRSGTAGDKPVFQREDYWNSIATTFAASCEESSSFVLAATVHTHPECRLLNFPYSCINMPGASNDNFSMMDFNHAIGLISAPTVSFGSRPEQVLDQQVEMIYMISAENRCIQKFEPKPDDKPFEKEDIEESGQAPWQFSLYGDYEKRQRRLCPY